MWYVMIRKRPTFKLCRTRREFMVVWGQTGQAAKKGWRLYNGYGYSSHEDACDVIKEGA